MPTITYTQYHFGDDSDYLTGSLDNEEIFAGYGNDSVRGEGGNDWLHGEQNDDYLYGGDAADILDGGSGDDRLEGGAGADRMIGDLGDDTFFIGSSEDGRGDIITGGLGIDTLDINFTDPTKAITFVAADPSVRTSIGGIVSIQGIERYTIHGDIQNDSLTGYRLGDSLWGWDGQDTLRGMDGDDYLYGEKGRDLLEGGSGYDSLHGGDDADKVYGGIGGDSLWGDAGDDTLDGGAGVNALYGGSGRDALYGGDSADTIYTDGWGSDWGSDADRVVAGGGDDAVTMGVTDIADGGTGIDTITLSFSQNGLGETFTMGNGKITLANGGWFNKFEALVFDGGTGNDKVGGGLYADSLYGGAGNDELRGGGSGDTLNGNAGNDTIHGDDGDDYIVESDGSDNLYGDAGNDLFSIGKTTGGVNIVDGGAGIDKVSLGQILDSLSAYVDLANQARNAGYARNTTFTGIEIFEGSSKDDVFLGSTAGDTFLGGGGGDVLNGRDGDDTLVGGAGSDMMIGGRGKDIFSLADWSTGFTYNWRGDEIVDFRSGEDKILIEGDKMGFPGGVGFELISGANPAATKVAPTLLFNSVTHELWWDEDGKGLDHDAVLVATFDNVTTLQASDFIVA